MSRPPSVPQLSIKSTAKPKLPLQIPSKLLRMTRTAAPLCSLGEVLEDSFEPDVTQFDRAIEAWVLGRKAGSFRQM